MRRRATVHAILIFVAVAVIVTRIEAEMTPVIAKGADTIGVDSMPVVDEDNSGSNQANHDMTSPWPGRDQAFEISMEASPVILYNGAGKRPIEVASRVGPWPQLEQADYAHVIFAHIPSIEVFDQIMRVGKFRRLHMYVIRAGERSYIYWVVNLLGQNINTVRNRLVENFPSLFFNIDPYTYADRLTSKTMGRVEFEPEERDEETGKALVHIGFFSDVSPQRKEEILRNHFLPEELSISGVDGVVRADPKKFLILAKWQEIRLISEYMRPLPLLNKSRAQVRLDKIQLMDTTITSPVPVWLNNHCAYMGDYYGRRVWVGVYDTGVDTVGGISTMSDFRELDSTGQARIRRASPLIIPWLNPSGALTDRGIHGTHVAGIIGGNGWNSSASGGARYMWRGVAPRVLFISQSGHLGWHGHANNHSHIIGNLGYYNPTDWRIDSLVHNHTTTHVMVYAAANNGLRSSGPEYGVQQGYYSILANTKNAITVGATYKDTAVRALFSSMGPTRDGRIKPDIVAPGGSYQYPDRSLAPLKIDIDYIRFIRSGGTVAKAYEFNSTSEGWVNGFATTNYSISGGILGFHSIWVGGRVGNTSVSGYTTNPNDSLIIRYRMRHPQIPSKVDKLAMSLSWNDKDGTVDFSLPIPDTTNFRVFRARLRDLYVVPPGRTDYGDHEWPTSSNIPITRLDLLLHSDTSTSVLSDNLLRSNAPRYAQQQGTSMAAPVVTGIAALMLEKWKTEVVPGADLHTEGPWNSTVKAILIHTATDLIKELPTQTEAGAGMLGEQVLYANPDLCGKVGGVCTRESATKSFVKYYKGPDYATGYGLVNAEKAVLYTDSNNIVQDSLGWAELHNYHIEVLAKTKSFRVTLAWDDLPGNVSGPIDAPKLVNDLHLAVQSPSGQVFYPWKLDPLPQNIVGNEPPSDGLDPIDSADVKPAYKGVNVVDNVEVVDVESEAGFLETGTWLITLGGPQDPVTNKQDYSLVTDQKVRKYVP